MSKESPNPARVAAVQFLYQCEAEKIFYFSAPHFENFVHQFSPQESGRVQKICSDVYNRLAEIDALLEKTSDKWPLARMATTDRIVLRLAVMELLENHTPPKVVLNEAIELAKKFGTQQSGRFVNGLLDKLLEDLDS